MIKKNNESARKRCSKAAVCGAVLETLIDLFAGHVLIPGILMKSDSLSLGNEKKQNVLFFLQEASTQES